ncbi:MAG: nucleoside triphosphate pyrophosphohydrolase [Rikenellaceae bacterium]|nr:nucleoside triphosphate pyrophosphohydrolase [Rikenellaceae bacterium]
MDRNEQLKAFGRLLDIMDALRTGCPWDREQTFESLRNNTIEETFELIDAVEQGDMDEIKKELGDLLLHVVFYAKIGDEQGAFDIGDVAGAICDKLVYRHPHVFGEAQADTAGQVTRNWEALKEKEKDRKGGVLSGVPKGMPPLVKACRIQEKAAAVGFDWERKEDVWDKVREELSEVETERTASAAGDATATSRMGEEFGDLIFAVINAARLYGVNPEQALEKCNKKFIRRFNHVEARAAGTGTPMRDLPLETLEKFWGEAKAGE